MARTFRNLYPIYVHCAEKMQFLNYTAGHSCYTLYVPLDDVNITNRCDVCLQQSTLLHIQDKVQLRKHLCKGASVKSLHNKYCVKNYNNKWNFNIEQKDIFSGDDTRELICSMEWGSFKLFQNYTKQGFKFEHQPSTFGVCVPAAPHFTMCSWLNPVIWCLTINDK